MVLWASSMLLWLGSVLTGVQQPQCLQALGDLLPGLARSFFYLSWQLLNSQFDSWFPSIFLPVTRPRRHAGTTQR